MKRRMRFDAHLGGAICGVTGLLAICGPASASTYTVSNTNNSGFGSLRQAIIDANNHLGADSIVFSTTGTIIVSSPLPAISGPVNLNASRNGAPSIRLYWSGFGNPAGLQLTNSADGSTVRGLVISNFDHSGIELLGLAWDPISNVTIAGNYLGAYDSATAATGNGYHGIWADDATNLHIGGTTPADANVIGGNGLSGIKLTGSSRGLLIEGNYVGTNAAGTVLGNRDGGIAFAADPDDSTNLIGGTIAGAGNVIAFNTGAGVSITSGDRTSVWGNSIYSNSGLSIDLGLAGQSTNDTLDRDFGANDLQNYPVLTSATLRTASVIRGTLNSSANDTFRLEFFTSPSSLSASKGPAKTFLGAVTVTTDAAGKATFTANVAGAPSGSIITATATDAGGCTSEVSAGIIGLNNQAPSAANDSYSTNEDTPLIVPAGGVLSNDGDADGDLLGTVLVNGPAHGTLTLAPNGGFSYTPNANYSGSDSFTYRAADGTASSSVATVNLTVNPVNDAPAAENDSYTTGEDTPLTVAAKGILANDTDGDSSALSAALVSGPAHGSLTLNPDGSFTYTPDANYHGFDSFTYRTSDGVASSDTATVTLTINAVNDAPTAADDSYTLDEDATKTVSAPGLLANDVDVDGEALTASLVSAPANGTLTLNLDGSFSYTPNANYHGTDSFTYQVSDGNSTSNSATVNLTVNPANDIPVIADDSFATNEDTPLVVSAAGVLANDTDLDGDALSAAMVTAPTHGSLTLNSDGSFTYTPDANYHGPDSFSYQASDGTAGSSVATVSLTVASVNDVPVAASCTGRVRAGNSVLLTMDATDADGDTLTYVIVSQPAHGTLSGSGRQCTYSANPGYMGTDTFTFKVNDGQADSNVATATINVSGAPQAIADSFSTHCGSPLTVAAPGVLGNDATYSNLPLTAVLSSKPANGTVTFNSDGSFTYRPRLAFTGTDQFTYQNLAGGVPSHPTTVSISVSATLPSAGFSRVQASGVFKLGKNRNLFGLTATRVGESGFTGSFTLRETPTGSNIESTQISAVVLDGSTLRVFGKARVSGSGIQDFVMDLENAQARSAQQIQFRLELGNGRVIGPASLVSGNVVVRQ